MLTEDEIEIMWDNLEAQGYSYADIQALWRVNPRAAFMLCRAALPNLRNTRWDDIDFTAVNEAWGWND